MTYGACPHGGDEISEELADDGQPLVADGLQRRFGVLGEGAGDTADLFVGVTRDQLPLAITKLS